MYQITRQANISKLLTNEHILWIIVFREIIYAPLSKKLFVQLEWQTMSWFLFDTKQDCQFLARHWVTFIAQMIEHLVCLIWWSLVGYTCQFFNRSLSLSHYLTVCGSQTLVGHWYLSLLASPCQVASTV